MKHAWMLTAAVAAALAAGTAQAAFVYVDEAAPPTDTRMITSVNEFQSQLAALNVMSFDVNGSLSLNAGGRVAIDYFGKDALFTNRFQWAGETLVTTPSSLVDPWAARSLGTFDVSAGVLDFAFCTDGGQGVGGFYPATCLSNAEEDSFEPTDLQQIGTRIVMNGNVAWLFWDDGGGGGAESHDDLMIRLTYQVPEPATLGLLGASLLAVGAGVRRRRRTS